MADDNVRRVDNTFDELQQSINALGENIRGKVEATNYFKRRVRVLLGLIGEAVVQIERLNQEMIENNNRLLNLPPGQNNPEQVNALLDRIQRLRNQIDGLQAALNGIQDDPTQNEVEQAINRLNGVLEPNNGNPNNGSGSSYMSSLGNAASGAVRGLGNAASGAVRGLTSFFSRNPNTQTQNVPPPGDEQNDNDEHNQAVNDLSRITQDRARQFNLGLDELNQQRDRIMQNARNQQEQDGQQVPPRPPGPPPRPPPRPPPPGQNGQQGELPDNLYFMGGRRKKRVTRRRRRKTAKRKGRRGGAWKSMKK